MWRVADCLRVHFDSPTFERCVNCEELLACGVHDPENRKMSTFKSLFRTVRNLLECSDPVFPERPEWDLLLGILEEADVFLQNPHGPEIAAPDLRRLLAATSRVTEHLSDLLCPSDLSDNSGNFAL